MKELLDLGYVLEVNQFLSYNQPLSAFFSCLIYRNILPLNNAACLQKEAQKSGFSKVSHLLQYFFGKVVPD